MKLSRLLPLVVFVLGGVAAARSGHRHRHGEHRRAHPKVDPDSPWSSVEACRDVLADGERLSKDPGTARIAAWNVRWFPDGGPGNAGGKPTNVEWLACAIAWLGADVVALEELKSTPRTQAALATLKAALATFTGDRYEVELDRCPGEGRQGVALLYDATRVRARGFRNLDALNPAGSACDEHLRPGFTGYFRFPGGADAHVVAVHLKSGEEPADFARRRASLSGLPAAYRALQETEKDPDVVVTGDFNTMGCLDCRPKLRAKDEISEFASLVRGFESPFRRLESDRGCSEYYRGEGNLLDHFLVSGAMAEVPRGARARVSGYCAEVSCARLDARDMPLAYRELSDHCPLVLDIEDRDAD